MQPPATSRTVAEIGNVATGHHLPESSFGRGAPEAGPKWREPDRSSRSHEGVTSAETAVGPSGSHAAEASRPIGCAAVYATLWAPTARFAQMVVGSREIGEELAQEAFLGLLKHFDRVDAPRAYLRRSIVNAATHHRRGASREQATLTAAREPVQLPAEVDETWAMLAGLPARQRAVLVLRFYEDLPEAEIARVLGCRPGTVKSLCARGLQRLRKDLA